MKKVFWTEHESTQVVLKVLSEIKADEAKLATFMAAGAEFRSMVVQAQLILPADRRLKEHTIMFGYSRAGKVWDAVMTAYHAGKALEEKTLAKAGDKTLAQHSPEAPVQLVGSHPPAAPVTPPWGLEAGLKEYANEQGRLFSEYLYRSLMDGARDAHERATQALAQNTETFSYIAAGKVRTVDPAQLAIQAGMGKSEIPLAQDQEKERKLKVFVIGGDAVGSYGKMIQKGLEDVYDFRFIDAKDKHPSSYKGADILVRTEFCSHPTADEVERNNRGAVLFKGRSAMTLNGQLSEYYIKYSDARKASTAAA